MSAASQKDLFADFVAWKSSFALFFMGQQHVWEKFPGREQNALIFAQRGKKFMGILLRPHKSLVPIRAGSGSKKSGMFLFGHLLVMVTGMAMPGFARSLA